MINTKLMGHQEKIVEFCLKKHYAGIFADYGTGKTLCALTLINEHRWKKVLIISTKLAIDSTWRDEIKKHSDFRFCVLQGTSKQKFNMLDHALGKCDDPRRYNEYGTSLIKPMLFLINFEGVKNIYFELQSIKFDAIFVDESTKIKTHSTERTKVIFELGSSTSNRYIMTGFPVTENLAELYSQIKFLDRGECFGKSYYAFLNKYFVRLGPKMLVKKSSIAQILKLISPFCIRITNEILKLPPKVYKEIDIEMTDKQRELLRHFNDSFQLEFGKVKIDTQYIFTLLAKSLQICDGFVQDNEKNLEVIETNKDEALIEVLEQINTEKNKVVIWCAFLFSVSKLKRILGRLGIPTLTLTGETENTNLVVSKFQNSKYTNVLIATQKKAAESVTLTSAKYAIYYSNVWSNDLRGNSEARIRRKGSEKHSSIMYIDLLTRGTVEKKVYDCLRKKKDLIDELKKAFLEMRN